MLSVNYTSPLSGFINNLFEDDAFLEIATKTFVAFQALLFHSIVLNVLPKFRLFFKN